MSFITREEIKDILDNNIQYQKKLYVRGFLITDQSNINMSQYPFYGNWKQIDIGDKWNILLHEDTKGYVVNRDGRSFFIIGHAYNPFSMEYEEINILHSLADSLAKGVSHYWERVSELTGVFCLGYVEKDELFFSTDCAGMQLLYYGFVQNHAYITSHNKLFNDLLGLKQMDYIRRLVESRFYHYWGTWLPGDISPYEDVYRVQPNFKYSFKNTKYSFERYFPLEIIKEVPMSEYDRVIEEISEVMKNNMFLIAKKWPNKRAAISVTGGRDSTMTLSSAHDVYEQLKYFSYYSNVDEEVDAKAAAEICDYLGLSHKVYAIPNTDEEVKDIEIVRKILECNAGCIGHNNANDVRKRAYFDTVDDFDMEIKSWVDELSRAEAQNKYNTLKWPKRPTPGYYRCMWKVILDPKLIKESNKIFKNYLKKYYDDQVFNRLSWMDLFYWEFSWSGGEGTFLTSEHKYAYDVTVPYNNRKLLNMMFTVPFEKRLESKIQIDTILRNDKRVIENGVHIKDISHTDFRALIIRTYLRIMSKI